MNYAKDHDIIDAEVISIEKTTRPEHEEQSHFSTGFRRHMSSFQQEARRSSFTLTKLGWKQLLIFLPIFLVLFAFALVFLAFFLLFFMAKAVLAFFSPSLSKKGPPPRF